MTPEQLKARQLQTQGAGVGVGVGRISPEMKDLLVRQAGEAAAAEAGAQIDMHNAKIDRQEKHAAEVKQLGEKMQKQASANETLKEAAAAHATEPHEKHPHKGKPSK